MGKIFINFQWAINSSYQSQSMDPCACGLHRRINFDLRSCGSEILKLYSTQSACQTRSVGPYSTWSFTQPPIKQTSYDVALNKIEHELRVWRVFHSMPPNFNKTLVNQTPISGNSGDLRQFQDNRNPSSHTQFLNGVEFIFRITSALSIDLETMKRVHRL